MRRGFDFKPNYLNSAFPTVFIEKKFKEKKTPNFFSCAKCFIYTHRTVYGIHIKYPNYKIQSICVMIAFVIRSGKENDEENFQFLSLSKTSMDWHLFLKTKNNTCEKHDA